MNKGAVKVAAIEKKRFEVISFADIKEIEKDDNSALTLYPVLVTTKILEEKMKE